MENVMLFFIVLGVLSPLLALTSMILPQYTVFFMKNPTRAKGIYFWFAVALISSGIVCYLRQYLS